MHLPERVEIAFSGPILGKYLDLTSTDKPTQEQISKYAELCVKSALQRSKKGLQMGMEDSLAFFAKTVDGVVRGRLWQRVS